MTKDPVFDRRFVGAATGIGLAYALIIVGLARLIGKEAAGVAGVALTALATGIFKQFETLRFKDLASDTRDFEIPRVFSWRMLLVVFGFISSLLLLSFLVSFVGHLFDWTIDTNDEVTVGALLTGGYLIGGMITSRSFPRATYSYATIGAVGAQIINTLMDFAGIAIADNWHNVDWASSLMFWFFVPAAALIGAKIGRLGTYGSYATRGQSAPNPAAATDG